MVLLGTRGPWLFQVIRESLGLTGRLHDRGTLRLADRLRLALEPGGLENRTATTKGDSLDGAESIRDLKLFVVSDVGRRS
jgi:hypothetical protein